MRVVTDRLFSSHFEGWLGLLELVFRLFRFGVKSSHSEELEFLWRWFLEVRLVSSWSFAVELSVGSSYLLFQSKLVDKLSSRMVRNEWIWEQEVLFKMRVLSYRYDPQYLLSFKPKESLRKDSLKYDRMSRLIKTWHILANQPICF